MKRNWDVIREVLIEVDVAANFNATVTVRQKNFELTMVYRDSQFNRSHRRTDMPTILGTHICFDFLIDS